MAIVRVGRSDVCVCNECGYAWKRRRPSFPRPPGRCPRCSTAVWNGGARKRAPRNPELRARYEFERRNRNVPPPADTTADEHDTAA